MGGDEAPAAVVAGAIQAASRRDVPVALVGPAGQLRDEIARQRAAGENGAAGAPVTLLEAAGVIGMHEAPLAALRRKPQASVRIAAEAVARGEACALFSAGHTGATFLAAHAALGVLPGIDRPALAVTVPTRTGAAILLDAGASVDCRPEHLVQFAFLGEAYARIALGIERPRVGLLSIGEEAGKGTDLVRDAHGKLSKTSLDFIGNLEAREFFSGRAEVIVCDGFTGNVALKVGEGLVEAAEDMLREELGAEFVTRIGGLLTRRAFERFKQRVDYAERGGAPLLGLNGIVVIGHGRSTPQAIENGIALAARLAREGMVERLKAALA
jgi:glycerol-3-phosphate acyltransferase PlsX